MRFTITIELYDEYIEGLLKEAPIMYKYIHQLVKNQVNMALLDKGKVLEIHKVMEKEK